MRISSPCERGVNATPPCPLYVCSIGIGSGGSESDAMDTDLAEKTVSSSTVLSGGDEVCECVCVHW